MSELNDEQYNFPYNKLKSHLKERIDTYNACYELLCVESCELRKVISDFIILRNEMRNAEDIKLIEMQIAELQGAEKKYSKLISNLPDKDFIYI